MPRHLLSMLIVLALTACGGGDPEPDEHVPTPGVDCSRPELCK